MTLEYISNSQTWSGEIINEVRYPRNIEQLWTAEELAAIGLRVRAIPEPEPYVPSHADMTNMVIAERERRLALGFDYDFGDGRGIHNIGTTTQDMKGWDEVTKATQALCALGYGSAPVTIVTNTGPATITAMEWQQILVAATQFRQPLWAASFALQAMDPIPDDYTNDIYWTP